MSYTEETPNEKLELLKAMEATKHEQPSTPICSLHASELKVADLECENIIHKPSRGRIEHEGQNRAQRRAELYAPKEGKLLNNRKKTSGRANNTVLNRMAYFAMQMGNYRYGLAKTGKKAA